MEILVTKRLLDAMVQFEDPKLQQACDGRAANGKLAESGKCLCLSDLRDLGVEKKFISYFKSIGFEWLLDHCMEEVPVALAKEFFTSFKFKSTTDLDADSITFRLFNEEMVMSIREWSLRMGLLKPEEDEEGAWNEREIGAPKDIEGFVAEETWRMIAHKKVAKFKTSSSKGVHITDPVLRLAQVYIGYNLLGQVGATLTTPELYFMWCMLNNVKVHLGYWVAYACQRVRTHSDRHLYTCNLLGAFIQRNVSMKIADSVTNLPMCIAPGYFDLAFLFNKGLTIIKDDVLRFYEVGKLDGPKVKAENVEGEGSERVADEGWQTRMEEMMLKLGANTLQQQEILLKLNEEAVAQRGLMAAQADKMTQAVEAMMKMVALVDQKVLRVQQRMPPKLPTALEQPAPRATSEKPASDIPAATSAKQKKDSTTTTSATVKKDTPRPGGQKAKKDDEPTPPPPKKAKTVARKSGPTGDQSQN